MNTDGVATAFELIIEEIEKVSKGIIHSGQEAFQNKDFEKARTLIESGEKLEAFRTKVSSLLSDWETSIDHDVKSKFTPRGPRTPSDTPITRTRTKTKQANKTILEVTFGNGKVIRDYYAAETFAQTIGEIGIQQVISLNLYESGIPLIQRTKHPERQQNEVNGWYICTHSSTARKKQLLEYISQELDVPLKVKIIAPMG